MRIKNRILVSGLLILSGCVSPGPSSLDSHVPEAWLLGPQGKENASASVEEEARFAGAVDGLFFAHQQALEDLKAPASDVRWHLAGLMADLSISVDGVIGIMTGSGSAAVQAIWKRADQAASVTENAPTLSIRANASPSEVLQRTDLLVRSALATGKIRDERLLKKSVRAHLERFQAIAAQLALAKDTPSSWKLAGMRVELEVQASGEVTPVTSAGGALSFRLDWDAKEARNEIRALPDPNDRVAAFLNSVARDLDEFAESASDIASSGGFGVESVRVGLGVSVEGEIGLAEGSAGIVGSLIFEKSDESVALSSRKAEQESSSIPLIGRGASAEAAVYPVDREKFRAGLRRASRIGRFFAERAARAEGKAWRIAELSTEFEVSLSGGVGLATVEGSGAIEVAFARKD